MKMQKENKKQINQTKTKLRDYRENSDIVTIINISIYKAFERFNETPINTDSIIADIIDEFGNENLKDITTAIKKGSFAEFGKTYRICTNEIFYWIKTFLKTKNNLEKW